MFGEKCPVPPCALYLAINFCPSTAALGVVSAVQVIPKISNV